VRVLLRIIQLFFAKVRRCGANAGQLGQMLVRAYRAQIVATQAEVSGSSPARLAVATRNKSTLPFEVILEIARGCAGVRGSPKVERRARALGRLISLTDDLADLTRDLRSGGANALALGGAVWSPDRATIAWRLLEGDVIHHSARRLEAELKTIADDQSGAGFNELLSATVGAWLGPSS